MNLIVDQKIEDIQYCNSISARERKLDRVPSYKYAPPDTTDYARNCSFPSSTQWEEE